MSNESVPRGGRAMALDYGLARIGVALADLTGTLASPLTTIETKDKREQLEAVMALVREYEATRLVVGIPFHLDGQVGDMALRAGKFADKLAGVTGLEVVRWDERLTSVQAEALLEAAGGRRKSKRHKKAGKGLIDRAAAAVLLQDWLDAGAPPQPHGPADG